MPMQIPICGDLFQNFNGKGLILTYLKRENLYLNEFAFRAQSYFYNLLAGYLHPRRDFDE